MFLAEAKQKKMPLIVVFNLAEGYCILLCLIRYCLASFSELRKYIRESSTGQGSLPRPKVTYALVLNSFHDMHPNPLDSVPFRIGNSVSTLGSSINGADCP